MKPCKFCSVFAASEDGYCPSCLEEAKARKKLFWIALLSFLVGSLVIVLIGLKMVV